MQRLDYVEKVEMLISDLKQQSYNNYFDKFRRVYAAKKYSDLILSQLGHGQLQTKPYMRVMVGLSLEKYHYNIPKNNAHQVLHASSKRGVKGTEYVLCATEKLKSENFKFEFKLVENMSNSELLSKSDILVD